MAIKNSRDFIDWIRASVPMPDHPFALATVQSEDPLYISFEGDIDDNGYPIVIQVTMTAIDSYTPTLGDRVIMVNTGRTWLILGSIPSDTSSARRLVDLSVGSFVNYSQSEMPLCWFVAGNKQITLEGTIQPRIGISAGSRTLVGTLPASAQPGSRVFISALYATTTTTMVPVRVEVNPDGSIWVANPTVLTATTGSITILMTYIAEVGVSVLISPVGINTAVTIPKPTVSANTNALVYPAVINPPATKIPAPVVTTPVNDNFVYGTTEPVLDNNVGLQIPESQLVIATSFAPVSNTSYSNKWFKCYVNFNAISNAKFTNCRFSGPVTGNSIINTHIINSNGAGGAIKNDNTDVIGKWGRKGQNYFKFCEFGGATKPGGSGLLFQSAISGGYWYMDRCEVWGGVDNIDPSGALLYIEMHGCWAGRTDARYPDLSGQHDSDGTKQTHNDTLQFKSGKYVYLFGNEFFSQFSPSSTSHPNYVIQNEVSAGNPPVSIQYPNTIIGFYQTSGNISDMEVDSNWFHCAVVTIGFDEQGLGAMTNMKITNNRCYYDGVHYTTTQIHAWGGKYVHGYETFHNWFMNVSDSANALTLAHASNNFSGNIDLANANKVIPYPYDDPPT